MTLLLLPNAMTIKVEEAEKTGSASNPPFGPFCADEIKKTKDRKRGTHFLC